MELKFINTLSESRMFRTKKNALLLPIDAAANLAFVNLMILNIFNYDYEFASLAGDYASRTKAYNNFDYHRISGTDLYISLNRLMGKDQTYDNDSDTIAIERVNIRIADIRTYLNNIASNKTNASSESRYLLKFEKDLNIQDSLLRSCQRLVGNWENLSHSQKALVVTRLDQFLRNSARMSDLTGPLGVLKSRRSFDVDDSKDKKKKSWKSWTIPAAAVAAAITYGVKSRRPSLQSRVKRTDHAKIPKVGQGTKFQKF